MNLDSLLNIFNNREIAISIYFFLFAVWALSQRKIRKSLLLVLKIIGDKQVLLTIIASLLYILIIIYGLYWVKFWDLSMLKDSIYWTFGVGVVLIFNSNNSIKDDHYFRNVLRNNCKLVMILEFIVGLHTFGFVAELIIIPVVLLFSIFLAMDDAKKEYSQMKLFLQIVFGIIGTSYLIYSGYMIYKDLSSFATSNSLKTLIFPIIMIFLFFPFAYLYSLFIHYESLFVRLQFSMKDPVLQRFAKMRVLVAVNFSLLKLRKMSHGFLFRDCHTKNDVKIEVKNRLGKKNYLETP